MSRSFALIGRGRAGGSMALALQDLGWTLSRTYGRGDDVAGAADGVALCLVATPDAAIAPTASTVVPTDAVLMHLSGVTGLDALAGHDRGAALHPLVALPNEERGAVALRSAWFAVGGDPLAEELAQALSGRWFPMRDEDRTLYHSAAVVASNHLVGLLGHVERMALEIGVPMDALLALARGALDDVSDLGAADALTGPAQRGDEATIERHRAALQTRLPDELAAYDALLHEVRRLAKPKPDANNHP